MEAIMKNVKTIPSYEVAKMMEKSHRDVLRMLEGCENPKIIGIIPTLTDNDFVVSELSQL